MATSNYGDEWTITGVEFQKDGQGGIFSPGSDRFVGDYFYNLGTTNMQKAGRLARLHVCV